MGATATGEMEGPLRLDFPFVAAPNSLGKCLALTVVSYQPTGSDSDARGEPELPGSVEGGGEGEGDGGDDRPTAARALFRWIRDSAATLPAESRRRFPNEFGATTKQKGSGSLRVGQSARRG